MRLLALSAFLLLLPGAAPSAPPAPAKPSGAVAAGTTPVIDPGGPARSDCPDTAATLAMREGGRLGPRSLGELPGADGYAAVYRRIDGCEAQVVIGYGIGGRSPADAVRQRR